MHPQEYLDLVDENDAVIGRKLRSEIYAEGFNNFRVVEVFLRNSKGQLWIPRRTATKAIFPLCLDFSAAGHVTSGETYDEAFAKEVQEELNIDVTTVPFKEIGYITPRDIPTYQYTKVYEITSDLVPNYNPNDFTEWFWLTPKELIERIESGDQAKNHLPLLVKRYYL